MKNTELSVNTVAFISSKSTADESHVLAEISLYLIFSLGSFCPSDVYRHESGRCCTLPFFLTFFIMSGGEKTSEVPGRTSGMYFDGIMTVTVLVKGRLLGCMGLVLQ